MVKTKVFAYERDDPDVACFRDCEILHAFVLEGLKHECCVLLRVIDKFRHFVTGTRWVDRTRKGSLFPRVVAR